MIKSAIRAPTHLFSIKDESLYRGRVGFGTHFFNEVEFDHIETKPIRIARKFETRSFNGLFEKIEFENIDYECYQKMSHMNLIGTK